MKKDDLVLGLRGCMAATSKFAPVSCHPTTSFLVEETIDFDQKIPQ